MCIDFFLFIHLHIHSINSYRGIELSTDDMAVNKTESFYSGCGDRWWTNKQITHKIITCCEDAVKQIKTPTRKTSGSYLDWQVYHLSLRGNGMKHKIYTNLGDFIVIGIISHPAQEKETSRVKFGKTLLPPTAPVRTHVWLWGCHLLF